MKTKWDYYSEIETQRQSKLLVYITGDRQGMEAKIADDSINWFIQQLDEIGIVKRISLLLNTNGGITLTGWNIVNLIRQFCDDFEVIVPIKARSTGTLMCLGADRIIMTKQATLGPIDPSINTLFNPTIQNGGNTPSRVPVSVEAIKAYFNFAKDELGLYDQNSLSALYRTLSEKVHPLALGEAYRAIGQIKMLAEKLLIHQMDDKEKIKKVISFLCSDSGSHDYTINRREARDSLGLHVEKPDQELYNSIIGAYRCIEHELELTNPFDPKIALGNGSSIQYEARRALIESIDGGSDVFLSKGILSTVNVGPGQVGIQDQRSFEGWQHEEKQ